MNSCFNFRERSLFSKARLGSCVSPWMLWIEKLFIRNLWFCFYGFSSKQEKLLLKNGKGSSCSCGVSWCLPIKGWQIRVVGKLWWPSVALQPLLLLGGIPEVLCLQPEQEKQNGIRILKGLVCWLLTDNPPGGTKGTMAERGTRCRSVRTKRKMLLNSNWLTQPVPETWISVPWMLLVVI